MEDLMRERKEHLLAAMKDPMYVPMKLKELAMLFDVPKEQREELKEVLDVLVAEGKANAVKKGEIQHTRGVCAGRNIFRQCKRVWICVCRGAGPGLVYPGR